MKTQTFIIFGENSYGLVRCCFKYYFKSYQKDKAKVGFKKITTLYHYDF